MNSEGTVLAFRTQRCSLAGSRQHNAFFFFFFFFFFSRILTPGWLSHAIHTPPHSYTIYGIGSEFLYGSMSEWRKPPQAEAIAVVY